jgi:hypothetical protein
MVMQPPPWIEKSQLLGLLHVGQDFHETNKKFEMLPASIAPCPPLHIQAAGGVILPRIDGFRDHSSMYLFDSKFDY